MGQRSEVRSTEVAEVTREALESALARIIEPKSGRNVLAADLIRGLVVRDGHVGFTLEVAAGEGPASEPLRLACEKAVLAVPGVRSVTAVLTAHSGGPPKPQAPASDSKLALSDIGAVIAVASGKGGVGKSTVAVNLALALAANGQRVGLLDADIYGPSVPRLLGLSGKPRAEAGKLVPFEAYGLKAMSIGFLVSDEQAVIWRGPMVVSALTQMLTGTDWGALDVLVVDMPPGTGDVQLSMAQRVPLAGAVIVSTPQDLSLIDARRAIAMFEKTAVPILGLIENMSLFVCPHCGKETPIFGHGGARAAAAERGLPFLGEVPLLPLIRETSDEGRPVVATRPGSPEAAAFTAIAAALRKELARGRRAAPKIIQD
jgi:ATP-binding protein involved in chromosome partitioning